VRTRVKICGVRTVEAVLSAAAAGADALGLNFHPPSPRYVEPDRALELVAAVPLWVTPVALFVNASADHIREVTAPLGVRCVQLYGEVTPELCGELSGYQIVYSLPANAAAAERIAPLRRWLAAVLLDAAVPGQHGGTGQTADWSAAAGLRKALGLLPVLLAGGLTPDNVGAAVKTVRPWAVDVASGVESAPGVKDPVRMAEFVAAVRRAE